MAPIPSLETRQSLDALYRATAYRAVWSQAPAGELLIRIGACHPPLDAWLDCIGADCWTYLTADNPRSRSLPAQENAARFAALRQSLEAGARTFLLGASQADDGQWPAEASVLIGGMPESEARILAGVWEQNAFLCGRRGGEARLIWHDDPV